MNEPIYCQWCPYATHRPAVHTYGSIPLCHTCYKYATQSDAATRERLERPVVLPVRKVRYAA